MPRAGLHNNKESVLSAEELAIRQGVIHATELLSNLVNELGEKI